MDVHSPRKWDSGGDIWKDFGKLRKAADQALKKKITHSDGMPSKKKQKIRLI